ncbi:VOC family protein [Mucilaginibacter sp. RS28]|uniref:VOC family protein n=1 Tax=Mucilaginibacter straminoryzae TaxID=2932774 RepID=A0A9X1X0M9_9SPHI|nr:VOC family protein [Mucilaginibacter straminoryzae]MCJ8209062.1 VOC family protein [Mucilaginibacter straminoryzae]
MKTISIISIPVTDQQRAKAFYTHLGFEIIVEAPAGPGQHWVQLGLPDTQTTITLVNWFESMVPGSVRGLVITVDNLDEEIAALEAKGITVEPISKTPWGRFATVKDPDGNALSLHQK